MKLDRIEHLRATPRELTPELEKILDKPFAILVPMVKRWEEDMKVAPLVTAAVVQANKVLFDAETAEMAPAVLVFSPDPKYATNALWISDLAARLSAMRDNPKSDPTGGQLAQRLLDEDSDFSEALPESVTGGIRAHWLVTYLSPEQLPGGFIPEHRLLPALATYEATALALIPPELYL